MGHWRDSRPPRRQERCPALAARIAASVLPCLISGRARVEGDIERERRCFFNFGEDLGRAFENCRRPTMPDASPNLAEGLPSRQPAAIIGGKAVRIVFDAPMRAEQVKPR